MPMLYQDLLQLRKCSLLPNFTERKAPTRKTKMAVKPRTTMKMTTTMTRMIRMTMTMMKISPEVKKEMTVIPRMTLKQMAMEELEVMTTMEMKTTTTTTTMETMAMRKRKKTTTMKTTRRKHLSHPPRRGSEDVHWLSPLSSFEFRVWSSEGSLACVSLWFRGRNIVVALVGNELPFLCVVMLWIHIICNNFFC